MFKTKNKANVNPLNPGCKSKPCNLSLSTKQPNQNLNQANLSPCQYEPPALTTLRLHSSHGNQNQVNFFAISFYQQKAILNNNFLNA